MKRNISAVLGLAGQQLAQPLSAGLSAGAGRRPPQIATDEGRRPTERRSYIFRNVNQTAISSSPRTAGESPQPDPCPPTGVPDRRRPTSRDIRKVHDKPIKLPPVLHHHHYDPHRGARRFKDAVRERSVARTIKRRSPRRSSDIRPSPSPETRRSNPQ